MRGEKGKVASVDESLRRFGIGVWRGLEEQLPGDTESRAGVRTAAVDRARSREGWRLPVEKKKRTNDEARPKGVSRKQKDIDSISERVACKQRKCTSFCRSWGSRLRAGRAVSKCMREG